MSDYIKREDAIDACLEETSTKWSTKEEAEEGRIIASVIKSLPSADVVKVVRCKDCKYLKPFTSQYGAGQYCECPCSFGGQGIKKPDDYCSYGERRDDREYNNSILNARKGEE